MFKAMYTTRMFDSVEDTGGINKSTDVTSTDLVSAKGKIKEVYCCCFDRSILMFMMREGF